MDMDNFLAAVDVVYEDVENQGNHISVNLLIQQWMQNVQLHQYFCFKFKPIICKYISVQVDIIIPMSC